MICYELLDELVDFGYPQTTDGKILQEYITQVGDQFIYNAIEWRHLILPVESGGSQARGGTEASPGRHQRRVLAQRWYQISQERGVSGRDRECQPVGRRLGERSQVRNF